MDKFIRELNDLMTKHGVIDIYPMAGKLMIMSAKEGEHPVFTDLDRPFVGPRLKDFLEHHVNREKR